MFSVDWLKRIGKTGQAESLWQFHRHVGLHAHVIEHANVCVTFHMHKVRHSKQHTTSLFPFQQLVRVKNVSGRRRWGKNKKQGGEGRTQNYVRVKSIELHELINSN